MESYPVTSLMSDDIQSSNLLQNRHISPFFRLWRLVPVLILAATTFLICFAWLLGSPLIIWADGQFHYVATDGVDSANCSVTTPCQTIQQAVTNATPGDEILVATGHYTGLHILDKDLILRGGFTTTNWFESPDPVRNRTVIDAETLGRVLHIYNAVDTPIVTIDGFDIIGGSSDIGAGVYNQLGELTLKHCRIYDNEADGPVSGGGGIASNGTLLMENCQVFSNTSLDVGSGGGISVIAGEAVLKASQIFENSALELGGGIYVFDGNVLIENNIIHNNISSNTGADPAYGGGLFFNDGTLAFENNTVYSNTAKTGGGGLALDIDGTVAITNSLIISNTAPTGGGIYNFGALNLSFTDFYGNLVSHYDEGSGPVDPTTIGSDNRIANPSLDSDLHLSPGSPAIDSITNTTVATDIDGQGRPFGSHSDRGADEYVATTGTCFARVQGGQVYTDVQSAVDAASSGETVQVAGYCTGTVSLDQALTLQGGYTVTDWIDPQYKTTLDGNAAGRVISVTGSGIVTVENFHITGGQANDGAGVYLNTSGEATLRNNVIYRNEATRYGGGVFNYGGGDATLQHNTIYSNTAATAGSGVYARYIGGDTGVVTLRNNLLVNHSGTAVDSSDAQGINSDYNDFYGNTANFGTNPSAGAHDLFKNPGLIDPDNGNFHLDYLTSEVVDRADPSSPVNIDFENDSRPLGLRSDIGADESVYFAAVDLSESISSPYVITDSSLIEGQRITFSHTITNIGQSPSLTDSFLISVVNSLGWDWQLVGIASPVVLSADLPVTFDVVVTAPASLPSNLYNQIAITATSETNEAMFDSVADVIATPGMTLSPSYTFNENPGTVFTYTHTLMNTGPVTDTFELAYNESPFNWTQLLTPTVITVGPGQSVPIYAAVMITDTAAAGSETVMTITAYSPGFDISAWVTDTTIANPIVSDRYVRTDGQDANNNCSVPTVPCATIGYALGQSIPGDDVKVAQGTYIGSGLVVNNLVNLLGGYNSSFGDPGDDVDPALTIINIQNNGQGLRVNGLSTVKGFTLRNGDTAFGGAGIAVQGSASPTLTRLIILDSATTGNGGGIYLTGGQPVLQDIVISNTVAGDRGGGIYINGGQPTIQNVTIDGVQAVNGGGIYNNNGTVIAQQLAISNSIATGRGGGVYNNLGAMTISQTTVYSNNAGSGGGGLYNAGGNLTLWNNFIYSNTTASGGGGVYNAANLNMVNDTLFANHASTYGGGVYHYNGSNLAITNTILVSNTAATGGGIYQSGGTGGGTATLDYNDIWGNTATGQYDNSNIGSGPNSISENPLFLDAATGNLHLANGSPAIDVADPDTFLRRDFENDVRPSDQGFDIGADERSGCLVRIVDQNRVYDPSPVGYDSGPFGVLQVAVEEAPDDHVIQVQGICKGVQSRMVSGQLISQTAILTDPDKSLTLEGGYGGGLDFIHDPAQYESFIDPEGAGRGMVISSTDPIWILDLTIINGQAQGLNETGGALYVNDAQVTMGSTVISNSQASYGGGVYANNSTLVVTSSATLNPGEFVNNAATDGGGLYVVSGTTTIYNGSFEQNQVSQYGGGIYNDNSTIAVERTQLISGTALQGGAVYNAAGFFSAQVITAAHNQAVGAFPRGGAFYNQDGRLSVTEGLIFENRSANQGGGFHNAGGSVTIARSTVLSNTAPNNGGAIFNTTPLTMVNTIVAYNSSENGDGGGVYNESSGMVLRHNTIYGNNAMGQGGGVYHEANGGAINSTLVVDNSATSGQGVFRTGLSSLDFRYNGVFDNLTNFTFDGTNITQDPLFLSTDPTSEEFLRLQGGSPAEDAGDDFYLPAISDDIDGDPRPSNQGVDIGADEISNCFLRNESTGIVYGNVQIAVGQSQPDDLLQVAGTCQGVNPAIDPGTGQTVTQTVFLTKSLRFRGGYNPDDWDEDPDPGVYTTTFDALDRGRVVYITGTAVVSMSGLHIRQGNYDNGGGVFVGSGVLTMSGNLIYSNTATSGGGLLNMATLYLMDNEIYGNDAIDGGGVYNAAGQSVLDDNDLRLNVATNNGGAFVHDGGTSLLQNNIIRDNQAGDDGGGVYNQASGLTTRHNTFYRNTATRGGGFFTPSAGPILVNNIFLDDTAADGDAIYGPAGFNPRYNNTYSPPATVNDLYGGGVSPGTGSLVNRNPDLVNPASGNFHMNDTSPVLDAGDPDMDPIFDFEGHLRPGDQGFDMGADERQSCYAQVTSVGAPESRTSGPIYGNLQWAINHSNPGDEIRVSHGICRGVHPYDDGGTTISQTIHITHDLVLRGGWDRVFETVDTAPTSPPDPTATTLDARNYDGGSSLGRVVFVTNGASVEMQSFIVLYGDATGLGGGPGGGDAGGGLYFDYGTSGETQMVDLYHHQADYGGAFFNAADNLVMRNTWAEDNQAVEDGGGLYHATGAMTVTVNAANAGTRIINSIAGNRGGAIYNAGGELWLVDNDDGDKWLSPTSIGGAGFGDNLAVQGGAVYNNAQLYLTNNDLAYNIAEQGGAIYNNTGGRVEILAGNEILGNSATAGAASGGGALYNSGVALLDHGSRLSFNHADQDGGAIFNNGDLTLQNTLIYTNTADSDGGGLFEDSSTNSTIIHNTFYNNTGAGTGGAIQVETGSNHNIQNNIFEANDAGSGGAIYVDGSAGATVNYNIYWQNSNFGVSGDGNSLIDEDPLLLNPSPNATEDYEPWDFHLSSDPSSPAIDAGDDLGLLYDFEDDPRPVNVAPDMGADEYDSCLAKLESNDTIYGRINDALDEAINGDRIDVAEGVCTENVQIDKDIIIEGSWNKDFSGKVTFDGNRYIATTVYGLYQTSSVINISTLVNSADLSWLRVTHGDTSVDGGGLSSAADTLQLSDMEFVSNSTSGNGGAIALSEGVVDISDVYMYQNEAGGCGGGLYVSGDTILDQSGMGAYENTAANGGGECFVGNASVTIRNLAAEGNQATTGDGGGIRAANNGLLQLTNLLLYTNTAAAGSGGGLYRNGNTDSLLAHNTIRENYAANSGGGVYNQDSSMTISASIVTSNTASSGNGIQAPSQVDVNHTLRWANGYAGSVSASGEINKPPRFLTTLFGPTNELHYTSPAINAVPDSVSTVGVDKTPENRPHMCRRDMGWDEYDLDRGLEWTLRQPDDASLAPTESVTYTFDLYNRSRHWMHRSTWSEGYGTGYTETITLTLEATRLAWPHEIVDITGGAVNRNRINDELATFDLGPGYTATIRVRVTVPANTLATIPGDNSTLDRAYLHYDALPWGCSTGLMSGNSSQAETRVELDRSFIIEPDNISTVPVRPGDTITYSHILTNTGNLTDTYNIQPGNSWYAGGQLAVAPTQIVDVGPGMAANIVLTVTIDEKAAGGLVDRSSVIGTSDNDPSIFTSAYNETPIAFITGTRYVALGGADIVLFEEEDIIGYNIPDNNCTVVNPDEQYPCRTIQHALNQAAPGDVIKIAQGVYTNVVTVTHQSQNLVQTAFISKPVSLYGGFVSSVDGWQANPPDHTAHPTIIDSQGLGRGVYITSTGTITLDRLVIRNGNAGGLQGGPANDDAGGLIYNEGADVVLHATRLYSGSAQVGGGLYHDHGSLLLQNSMLHDNDADTGGAVWIGDGPAVLQNNTFYRNQAANTGGAVYDDAGDLTINNTIFATHTVDAVSVAAGVNAALDYNLYEGNTDDYDYVEDGSSTLPPGSNNVFAPPQFEDDALPDLHLSLDSPAIDNGSNILNIDYDNDSRPQPDGGLHDIGADERVPLPGIDFRPNVITNTVADREIVIVHTLQNTGELSDTFALTYTITPDWPVEFDQPFPYVVSLDVNEIHTVTVTYTVPADPGAAMGTAVITASSGVTSAYVTDRIFINSPEWAISKTVDPADSVQPGGYLTYTITVNNIGEIDTIGTYTVSDRLPEHTHFVSAGDSPVLTSPVVQWITNTSVATNASATFTYVVTVSRPLTDAIDITNQVYTVTGGSAPNEAVGNPVSVAVDAPAILTTAKTAGDDPVQAGQYLTYTIAITNDAAALGPALDVAISDTLPVDVSPVGMGFISPATGAYTQAGNTLEWLLDSVWPGETAYLTATVQVDTPLAAGTVLTNTYEITTANLPARVRGDLTTTVTSTNIITLRKTVQPESVTTGEIVTYTVVVTNSGNGIAQVALTDELYAGFDPASVVTDVVVPGNNGSVTVHFTATTPITAGLYDNPFITATYDLSQTVVTNTAPVLVEGTITGLNLTNDSPTSVPQATTLTANLTAGSNVTYTLDYGDGTPVVTGPITAGIPVTDTHAYAAGVYIAIITATNTADTQVATTTVIVDEDIAGLDLTSDSPTALGQPTTLTATLTAGSNVTYTLNYGDGTPVVTGNFSDPLALLHTYGSAGTFTAIITVANNTSSDVATTTVEILTPPAAPVLIAPPNGTLTRTASLTMEWSTVPQAVTYTLHLSGSTFNVPPLGSIGATVVSPTVLADGVYTWTAEAINSIGYSSGVTDTWAFTVDTTAPSIPVPQYPLAAATVTTNTVPFTWTMSNDNLSGVVSYTLMITGPSQTYIHTVGSITATNRLLTPDGVYTWTIQAIDAAGNESAYSVPITFTVDATEPAPPVLIAPANGLITRSQAITLEWSTVTQALTYTLHLSGSTFDVPPLGNVGATVISPTVLGEGVYTWAVEALDDVGRSSGLTDTWVFTIDLTAPPRPTLIAPPDTAITTTNPITFSWSDVGGDVDHYNLQLSYGISTTIYGPFTNNSTLLGLPYGDGVYTWMVEAVDAVGNASGYTDTWTLQLFGAPPLRPQLISPISGTILTTDTVTFDWSDTGAVTYTLSISDSLYPVTDTTHIVPGLADGVYTWTVAALGEIGQTNGFTDTWLFTVDTTPPSVPATDSPDPGDIISTTTTTFWWFRALDNLTGVLSYTVVVTGPSAGVYSDTVGTILADLTLGGEGVYTWMVQAIDGAGNPSDFSPPITFTLDLTPPLTPTLIAPPDGTLTRTNTVDLVWSRINDAANYQVYLNSDPALVPDPGTGSNVVSSTVLADGVYTWTVEALDSFSRSSGITATWAFTVDTTAPSVPGAVSPGLGDTLASNMVPFTWTESSDALSGVVSYTVVVTGPGASVYSGTVGSITSTLLTLGADGVYTWGVRAIDAAGNVSALSPGVPFTVDATAPEAPVLIAPPDGTITNTTAITLEWLRVEQTVSYTVQLNGSAYEVPQAGSASIISPTVLAEGVYTWTVEAFDSFGRGSGLAASWVFTIDTTLPPAPALISPPNETVTSTSTINFIWSDAGLDADHYNLQITYGVTPTIYGPITGTSESIMLNDGDGVYTWTVEAVDAAGNHSGYTDTWTLELQGTPPPIPVLISPISGTLFATDTVAFEWTDTGAVTYTLIVSDTVYPTADTTYTVPGLADGVYTWTVAAYNGLGLTNGPAATWAFTVDTTAPSVPGAVSPGLGDTLASNMVPFTWTESSDALSGVVSYTVVVTGPGASVYSGTVGSITSTLLTLGADGVYTWGVRAIDAAGNVSALSPGVPFTVDATAPEAPVLIAPPDGTITNTTAITLEWLRVEQTVSYTVQLNGSAYEVPQAGSASIISPTVLAEGVYTWTVEAFDSFGRGSGLAASWVFTIDTTLPPAPALISPPDGTITHTDHLTFTWTTVSEADHYNVELSYGLSSFITRFDDNSAWLGLIQGDGVYSWTVESVDAAGNSSGYTDTWTVILDTTPPTSPTLIAPVGGVVLTDSNVAFSWNPSTDNLPGVISYTLIVTDSAGSQVTMVTTTTTGVDLSITPDGVYTWMVQAIDQAGNVSLPGGPETFSVDATAPDRPVLLNPPDQTYTNSSNVTFEWTAETDAVTYTLDVDGAFYPVNSTTHLVPLAQGVHTWTVQAIDMFDRPSGYTDTWQLTVDWTAPNSPTLQTPTNGQVISDTAQPTFDWSDSSDQPGGLSEPVTYTFVITYPDGSVYQHNTGTVSDYTPGSGLRSGVYTWTVIAYDQAGNSSASTQAYTVTIESNVGDVYLPIVLKNYTPPPPRPDLIISNMTVTGDGTLMVTVQNQSTVPVSFGNNFHVNVYRTSNLNSPLVSWGVQGGWMGAGQSRTFTYALPSGSYDLRAWADPWEVVDESDEDNNTLNQSFSVTGAGGDPVLTPLELSEPLPTPTLTP